MSENKKTFINILVYSQALIDSIEDLKEKSEYMGTLKNKVGMFSRYIDKYVTDRIYKGKAKETEKKAMNDIIHSRVKLFNVLESLSNEQRLTANDKDEKNLRK